MFSYLPSYLIKELKSIGLECINEIRIRHNSKITVLVGGENKKLNVIIKNKEDIEEIVYNACKRSIYSYDEDIKNGFITTDKGERIGLAGEFVIKNGKVSTIKNFSSLVIRIPSEVNSFSCKFYNEYYSKKSLLVFSRPYGGKTTFIRDLIKNISSDNIGNVVVIDERNEIASKLSGKGFNLGDNVDVLTYSNKYFGFSQAIRALNPDFVVTDELSSEEDALGVLRAIYGGVNVIATVHASSINDLIKIKFIKELIENKVFSEFVKIDNDFGVRKLTVYNQNLEKLCSY